MTDTQTPPPPPSPAGPRYVLLALVSVMVILLVVVIIILVSNSDDESAAATSAVNPTLAATSTTSGFGAASTAATTQAPGTTAPTTTLPTTTLPPFQGDTGDEVAEGDFLGVFNFLHDIRFQQREAGFTRVVFDFEEGEVPWWSIGYTSGPFIDTADNPIAVGGTAYLSVLMSASSFDLSGAEVRITYDGLDRIPTNTNSVVEIVLIDDFEGISTWVIGVDGEKPFAVGTLTDPPRVFIDIGD